MVNNYQIVIDHRLRRATLMTFPDGPNDETDFASYDELMDWLYNATAQVSLHQSQVWTQGLGG